MQIPDPKLAESGIARRVKITHKAYSQAQRNKRLRKLLRHCSKR
jgi:hypothetical protein